jgi:hypothetical protein
MSKRIFARQGVGFAGWIRRRAAPARAQLDVEALPLYQIAFWPDGWESAQDGSVVVRDTHETAEARRWYAMAERNRVGRGSTALPRQAERTMRMHRIGVPRGIVDLVGTRFRTEQAASVAVRLIAADWVDERRRMLSAEPAVSLTTRERLWSGSRHAEVRESEDVDLLVRRLISVCVAEGLIPRLEYGVEARLHDGYGLRRWSCQVTVRQGLARAQADAIAALLSLALVPWNRGVSGDGKTWTLLSVRVEAAPR